MSGGAFAAMGSRSCEMFLAGLVDKLGGIPILSVDYSLTVPYPVAHQELMDVYLWLYSGKDDVKAKLGFHPKQVILCGDSVGAFLSLCLTIVLNELNKMLAKSGQPNGRFVPLPVSIVSAYGIFSFSKMFPSLCLDAIDPMVESHVLAVVVSVFGANVWCNGDFKRIENGERYRRIAEKNKNRLVDEKMREFRRVYGIKNWRKNDASLPWFHCDFDTFSNRAEYIASFFDRPFIEPTLYEAQFDQLKEVSLYCCVGNNDCTLDCSIDLVRCWKGKACLDVFDRLPHAFLQMASASTETSEAGQIFAERLQEACGLFDGG